MTSSLKEEVIYHRGHKSACLTSPAHSSRPELFTLPPSAIYYVATVRQNSGRYTGDTLVRVAPGIEMDCFMCPHKPGKPGKTWKVYAFEQKNTYMTFIRGL